MLIRQIERGYMPDYRNSSRQIHNHNIQGYSLELVWITKIIPQVQGTYGNTLEKIHSRKTLSQNSSITM
jgi:hypothetical protein